MPTTWAFRPASNAGIWTGARARIVHQRQPDGAGAAARKARAEYGAAHPALGVGLHVDLGEWAVRDGQWGGGLRARAAARCRGGSGPRRWRQLERFRQLIGSEPDHIDSHSSAPSRAGRAPCSSRWRIDWACRSAGRAGIGFFWGDFYGQTEVGSRCPDASASRALLVLLDRCRRGPPNSPAIRDSSRIAIRWAAHLPARAQRRSPPCFATPACAPPSLTGIVLAHLRAGGAPSGASGERAAVGGGERLRIVVMGYVVRGPLAARPGITCSTSSGCTTWGTTSGTSRTARTTELLRPRAAGGDRRPELRPALRSPRVRARRSRRALGLSRRPCRTLATGRPGERMKGIAASADVLINVSGVNPVRRGSRASSTGCWSTPIRCSRRST